MIEFLDKILEKKPLQLLTLTILMSFAVIGVYFSEIQKKDVRQSQLSIEKERIENIDKQLGVLYKKAYSNTDTVPVKTFLNEIQFLKAERVEAVKSIDDINKTADSPTLIFAVTLSLLSISIITFLTTTFKNSTQNFTKSERKDKLSSNLPEKQIPIIEKFEDFKERIKEESSRLNRQALINLSLCFFIAFAFMGFVGYTTIFKSEISNGLTWEYFIMNYIPKLTGILGILTMFLYFVRLYKANIIDAKYYQNELTNVEFRYLALLTSLELENNELTSNIIKDFILIDRNSILPKDQTTLELERIKIENELNKSYLSQIWELKSIFEDKKIENK